MWGVEVAVERGGGKRRKWVFRYPKVKWNKDCVEPTTRKEERGISQMMTGFFIVKLMVSFCLFFLILLLLGVELLESQLLMFVISMTFWGYGRISENRLEKKRYFLSLTMLRLTCPLEDDSEGRELLFWKFLPIHQTSIQLRMSGL